MPPNRANDVWIGLLIGRLQALTREDNVQGPRTLAMLRRGLDKPATSVLGTVGHLFNDVPDSDLEHACVVASLFALWHQGGKSSGGKPPRNLGASLARLVAATGSESVEKRFATLLNSDVEDLPSRLKQAISLLKAKDIAVNWWQLLRDLTNWTREDRPVQWAWARAFWKTLPLDRDLTETPELERSTAT